ncbi:MAG: hypothetical protein ACO263_06190, partial [Cyclobacteriaceae bacterium]
KIYELSNVKPGNAMSLNRMKKVREMVASKTMEQRIYDLQMNPDRADVIVPASSIYIRAMEWAGATNMIVPEVGLKDGIILHLYEKNLRRKNVQFINTQDQSQGNKAIVKF